MATILTEADVASVLSMPEAIRLVEESFALFAAGRAIVAPRVALKLTGEAGAFRIMAASVPDMGVFGLKTLTGVPGRRRIGLTYFAMLLFDSGTGALSAMIPATRITSVRTGAAGAVAVKHLARPDARVLGVFGAGVQARAQIDAILAVRQLELVKILDVDLQRAQSVAAALRADGVPAVVAGNAAELMADCDIIVAATTASDPVVRGQWLEPGVHVNAIGANSPTKRELDVAAMQRGHVVLDFKEQVVAEAGDIIEGIKSGIWASGGPDVELSDVIAGKKPGRQSAEDITIFKSVGVAFQDVAVASWVHQQARERGLGMNIDLEQAPSEVV